MQLDILPGSRALQLGIHLADAPRRCFGSIQQQHHDRVAVTIETVISRYGLGMLSDNQKDISNMVNSIHRHARAVGMLAVLSMFAAWSVISATAQDIKAPDYDVIVASPDRSDGDRQADQRRQPARMLAFAGVKAGMKVLDMEANAGYSTELLARTVGPTGVVYAQDSAAVIERFVKDKFDIRAQKPAMKNVVHVVRNFDDPVPPEVGGLDLITFFFAYHDITYMEVDRAAMNQKMFAALKPGGFLIIADHSAHPGDGTTVAKTLHRIEETTLRQEIEAAGFKLAGEADFLRHPEDPRDAAVFRPQIPTDEFVLKYQKPL
jgi:predicted methyltransferase